VYGAAALFYRVVSGFVPPKSSLIGRERPLAPLLDLVMDIPANISDAVAAAMKPDPGSRTQEMGAFVGSFVRTEMSNTAVYDAGAASEIRRARMQKREQRADNRRRGKYVVFGMLLTMIAIAAALYMIMTTFYPGLLTGMTPPGAETSATEESAPTEAAEAPLPAEGDMPNLIGQPLESVEEEYGERFELSVQEDYNEQYEAGVIYDQSPEDGVLIADGGTIILSVSKGSLRVVMPNIVGFTREEAREAMKELTEGKDFEVPYGEIDKYFLDAPPGTVVETIPVAGESFDPQSTRVTIFYMLGESGDETQAGEEPTADIGPGPEDYDDLPHEPPSEQPVEDVRDDDN
jgi:serine/threonine-protein kinase